MRGKLIYRFCSCGCATGHEEYSGFLLEADYCQEGARLGERAEELGAALSAERASSTRRSLRARKALYLQMVRAVRDLESHRDANASGSPANRGAGELPPPGSYARSEQTSPIPQGG